MTRLYDRGGLGRRRSPRARTAALAAAALITGLFNAGSSRAACQLREAAELPVVNDRGSPLVEAEIDGRKVIMMVDTGSASTLIFRSAAIAMGLPRTSLPNARFFGAGGETAPETTVLKRFALGQAAVSNLRLMVAGEQGGHWGDVVGLLGWDLLSHWDVEFDLAHHVIRLLSPLGCKGDQVAYWANAYSAAPMNGWTDDNPKIWTTVLLNGRSIEAIIDSGASASVMTPGAATHAGVAAADFTGSAEKSYGVGAAVMTSRIATLNSFKLGDEVINHADIRVSDMYSQDRYSKTGSLVGEREDNLPDVLLGADFLRAHRMLVATDQRMIYFTYNGGPVFRLTPEPSVAEREPGGPQRAATPSASSWPSAAPPTVAATKP